MEIQKFDDFILNEARTNKKELVSEIIDMFKKKPNVEMDTIPNERGIYSMAGMKAYMSKYPSLAVSQAFHDIQNDKTVDLKSIYVRIEKWEKSIPYWYIGLSEAEAKKLKSEYEEEEKKKNKKEIDSRVDRRKASSVASAAKAEAKKTASAARKKTATKKASGEGVERKEGSTPKKRATRTTKVKK